MSRLNLISETDIIQSPRFSCDVMYVADATITDDVNIDDIKEGCRMLMFNLMLTVVNVIIRPTMPTLFSQALVGEHNNSPPQNTNIITKLVI